jgi:hypothetical protein
MRTAASLITRCPRTAHPGEHAQEAVVVARRAGEARAAERQRRIVEEDRIGAEVDRQQVPSARK